MEDRASERTGGERPAGRRPSREKPFWPEAREAAFKQLEENGYPRAGDGGQAKLENHIAEWLTQRGYEAAESTIRYRVKAWIKEYKQTVAAPM
jgi:hypothetical protein